MESLFRALGFWGLKCSCQSDGAGDAETGTGQFGARIQEIPGLPQRVRLLEDDMAMEARWRRCDQLNDRLMGEMDRVFDDTATESISGRLQLARKAVVKTVEQEVRINGGGHAGRDIFFSGLRRKAVNNPIPQRDTRAGGNVTGSGRNSVVLSPDRSEMLCVHHGRTTETGDKRVVFIDRREISPDGALLVHGPTSDPQPVPFSGR